MIVHPETERASAIITASGILDTGGAKTISAMTLDGGTAATGATAVLNNSTDGSGTDKWALRATQYGSASISFPKPIPLTTACYVTLTGTSSRLSIAFA